MQKFIHLKFFSFILLAVMLAVTIDGARESAQAMQSRVSAAKDQTSHSEISTPHHCPCTPLEEHKDNDCCDTCANCACHAPLTVRPFQLSYNPIIVVLSSHDPFKLLPEVYLSKFIPPQQA
jgi:hypothetical protein